MNLTVPTGASLTDGQGLGTILDEDPTPTISINDATVAEPAMVPVWATFTITLSGASSQNVSVQYATLAGTATNPGDYTNIVPLTLTFTPGQVSKTVNVVVKADALAEGPENFTLELSNAATVAILDGSGLGTIT